LDRGAGWIAPNDAEAEPTLAAESEPEAAERVGVGARGDCAVLALELDGGRGRRRRELAEQVAVLDLDVDREVLRAGGQPASAAAARQGSRFVENRILQQLGELRVEPAQTERRLREVGHLGRNGIGTAQHGTQLVEELVGLRHHAVPPESAESTET